MHPKNLSEKTLYAIDQFVMRGGKLVVFTDPYCFMGDPPPQNPQNPFGGSSHDASSELNRLLTAWGVEMRTGEFAGDLVFAERVGAGPRGGAMPFPGSMSIDQRGLNDEAVVTQGLKKSIGVLFAGHLARVEDAGGSTRGRPR